MAYTLKDCRRRLLALQRERDGEYWLDHWRELSDYILPRRGKFLEDNPNKGNKRQTKIVDSRGTLAARTLASGMMAGITSPARPWFRYTTSDPELMEFGPVKEYLNLAETRARQIFAHSNIYNTLHTIYEELGVFGTAVSMIYEDFESVVRGYPLTAGEYALGLSGRLDVDSLAREFDMTVGQVVERFGLENCSDATRNLYDRGDYDKWIRVCHLVEPNRGRDTRMADAANKRFRSVWWEKSGDQAEPSKFLRRSGFDDFPAVCPRWHVTGTDIYGRSPGMEALPDVKQLQHEQLAKHKAIDKMVDPPLLAHTTLRNKHASLLPGGVTYADNIAQGNGVRPLYEINPRVNELMMDIAETHQAIDRTFYADLFLMLAHRSPRDPQMTATEVAERHEEKLLALGPVLERLQNELLDPLVMRVYSTMVNNRMLPPAPPELVEGGGFTVQHISMLAQAQKAVATASIERLAGYVGNIAAVNPQILQKVDWDQSVDEYAEAVGAPPRMVRTDEAVAEDRARAAQAEQAAVAAEQAPLAAQSAKVLSETDVRTDSALTRLLGLA